MATGRRDERRHLPLCLFHRTRRMGPAFTGATRSVLPWHASHCTAGDEYAKNRL